MISGQTKHKGSGRVLDLSSGGCRLDSPSVMAPRTTVGLQVQVPGWERPLVVDGAYVRWEKGQLVGLEFVRMSKSEQQRLEKVIADLRIRGDDEVP